MSENNKNLFPWQRPLRDPTDFATIIYAIRATSCREDDEDRSRTFWANRTRRTSTNRKQFCHSESPEGVIPQKTNFRVFSSRVTIFVSRVVLELRRENEIAKKTKKLVAMATSLEGSRRSSTATAESNAENSVKIRPVEVKIIGLTEIVKRERYRSKTYGYPVTYTFYRVAKQVLYRILTTLSNYVSLVSFKF